MIDERLLRRAEELVGVPFLAYLVNVPEETVGHIFPSPNDPTWKGARLRERLEHTLESGETLRDFQVAMQSSGANDGMIRLGASRVPVATDSTLLLVSIEETAAP